MVGVCMRVRAGGGTRAARRAQVSETSSVCRKKSPVSCKTEPRGRGEKIPVSGVDAAEKSPISGEKDPRNATKET